MTSPIAKQNGHVIGVTRAEMDTLRLDELTGYQFIYEKPQYADYGYNDVSRATDVSGAGNREPNGGHNNSSSSKTKKTQKSGAQKPQQQTRATKARKRHDTVTSRVPLDEKLDTFARRTTAHGWGQVANERLIVFKLFWVLLTISAYIGNGWHISLLVKQYLKYPTEQISRVQFKSIDFPSITLCNIQPMSFSTGLTLLGDETSKFFYWTNTTDAFERQHGAQYNLSDSEFEYMFNRLRQPVGYFENIGDEALEVGHKLSDFVLRCTFAGEDCFAENFTLYQSPTYFNCYTFNGGNISINKLIAKTTGPQQGLSLVLYLEVDNGDSLYNGTYHTLSNIGNAAGVRVVIHSPDSLPTPVDTGFDIPPGYSTSVGIRVEKAERLDPPYGDCRKHLELSFSDRFVYSQLGCLLLCQQRQVIDSCQCMSSLLPIPPDDDSDNIYDSGGHQYHFCGFFNQSDPQYFFDNLSCEASVMNNFASDDDLQSSCNCHPPCEEKSYATDVSYAYWPLDFAQRDFFQKYVIDHSTINNNNNHTKAYSNLAHFNSTQLIQSGLIRKNFVRLNIYLKDLIVAEIIQKRTYELENLFSDMGGTFGLWIGVSILSWFEIVEFFCKLLASGARRMCRRQCAGVVDSRSSSTVEPVDDDTAVEPNNN